MYARTPLIASAAIILAASAASADLMPPDWVDYSGATEATAWDNSQFAVSGVFGPGGFDFYGGAHNTTDIMIQANGYLGFGPSLWNADDPVVWPFYKWDEDGSRIAAAMWHDFNPSGAKGHIYYQTVGSANSRRFVVTWDTWEDGAETRENIFQIQLHEATGDISYHYYRLDGVEHGSRVGVNYGDGVEYTGFWYDGDTNFDGDGAYTANQDAPNGSLEGWTITYSFNEETGSYEATSNYVPEPGTMALLLIGIAGGIAARRRSH